MARWAFQDTMGNKQDILDAIRRQQKNKSQVDRPGLDVEWTRFDDPRAKFTEMVQAVGGECLTVANHQAAGHELANRAAFQSSQRVYCSVAGCVESNFDLDAINDPRDLESVDYAILPGHFCVAENGAVWVTDQTLKHRAIYFIVQHLVLVVPADQIVHNMHEAYQRLNFPGPGFGVFISGPSKTADIEQSLVIGAHGPRSLVVFLIDGSQ